MDLAVWNANERGEGGFADGTADRASGRPLIYPRRWEQISGAAFWTMQPRWSSTALWCRCWFRSSSRVKWSRGVIASSML